MGAAPQLPQVRQNPISVYGLPPILPGDFNLEKTQRKTWQGSSFRLAGRNKNIMRMLFVLINYESTICAQYIHTYVYIYI